MDLIYTFLSSKGALIYIFIIGEPLLNSLCTCLSYVCSSVLFEFFSMAQVGLLINEASRSHSNTQHSVGLLWTSDQPEAETSTWQRMTLKRDSNAPVGIRNLSPSKRTATDPCLISRGHWDRLIWNILAHSLPQKTYFQEAKCKNWRILECCAVSTGKEQSKFRSSCISGVIIRWKPQISP
jgi:hypothetical protein